MSTLCIFFLFPRYMHGRCVLPVCGFVVHVQRCSLISRVFILMKSLINLKVYLSLSLLKEIIASLRSRNFTDTASLHSYKET